MAAQERNQMLRSFARMLFGHWQLLALLLAAGIFAGWLLAQREPTVYSGKLELASDSASAVLPNAVTLRRLLLTDDALKTLLPVNVVPTDDRLSELEQNIQIEPVLNEDRRGVALWRIVVNVAANSSTEAKGKLDNYLTEAKRGFSPAPRGGEIGDAGEGDDVAYDANDIVELEQVEPGVELVAYQEDEELRSPAARRLAKQLADLEQQKAEAMDLAGVLLSESALGPDDRVYSAVPSLKDQAAKLNDLVRRKERLSAVLTANNPQMKALEKQVATATEDVKKKRQEAASRLAGRGSELDSKIAEVKQQLANAASAPPTAKGTDVPPGAKTSEQAGSPETRPTESNPPPPVYSTRTPLVIAGPFVNPTPVHQPQWSRNIIWGAVIGLIVGFLAVLLRTSADQRIHVPRDMEALGMEIEVLGTVPQINRGAPVDFSRVTTSPQKPEGASNE